jgi:hypothetical protein
VITVHIDTVATNTVLILSAYLLTYLITYLVTYVLTTYLLSFLLQLLYCCFVETVTMPIQRKVAAVDVQQAYLSPPREPFCNRSRAVANNLTGDSDLYLLSAPMISGQTGSRIKKKVNI